MRMNKKQHKNHITGLRGIAILGIILFHASQVDFPNGYLGVSVFLCITGYFLFASFLRKDFQFTLSSFARKRITRLFPSYIASIAFFLFVCAWLIPFDYFEKTAKLAISSLAGLSNIYYKRVIGDYFADASGSWIFLTTWYFSVLLQVYVFYAIVAKIGTFFSTRLRIILISGCGVASFIWLFPPSCWLDIFGADKSIIANAYFSSITRFWIVIAGGLAVFLPPIQSTGRQNFLYLCSLLGIVYSLFFSQSSLVIQDITIVPLSMLCIRYAPTGYLKLLPENIVIRRIGVYSFSLYLIHWPLLVLGNYLRDGKTDVWYYLLITTLILLLSVILYETVERRAFSLSSTISAWFITMTGAILIMTTHGMQHYLHPIVASLGSQAYDDYRPISYDAPIAAHFPKHLVWSNTTPFYKPAQPLCHLGVAKKEPDFILMGDSHALALAPGMDIIGKQAGWSGVFAQTYVMPFNQCAAKSAAMTWTRDKQAAILHYLHMHPELRTVVLAQFWSARMGMNYNDWTGALVDIKKTPEKDYEKTRDFVLELRKIGKNVIILTDVPFFSPKHSSTGCAEGVQFYDISSYVRKNTLLHRPLDETRLLVSLREYQDDNRIASHVLDKICNDKLATVIHLENFIMNNELFHACRNGKLLYNDAHHLSPDGAAIIMNDIKEVFSQALETADVPKSY